MKYVLYYHLMQIFGAKLHIDGVQNKDANTVLSGLLNTVYTVAGIVAVMVIIAGGIYYTISQGSPEKITRAKNAILYACIGLVVVIMAFGITWFVSNNIG